MKPRIGCYYKSPTKQRQKSVDSPRQPLRANTRVLNAQRSKSAGRSIGSDAGDARRNGGEPVPSCNERIIGSAADSLGDDDVFDPRKTIRLSKPGYLKPDTHMFDNDMFESDTTTDKENAVAKQRSAAAVRVVPSQSVPPPERPLFKERETITMDGLLREPSDASQGCDRSSSSKQRRQRHADS